MAAPFAEFANNKRLLWIAREWEQYSEELAPWAMEYLVNRRDVWSQYTLREGKVGVVMLPIKERRAAGTDMITLNKLQRHFAGRAVSHLIGVHSISDHRTCKWFAIDVDLHDPTMAGADEIAAANLAACREWAERLRGQMFDPCLMDSNGSGGYHLWVLLDHEYPLADTYDFADALRSDWQEKGLPRRPEIFPPKREVKDDDLPYGLRLPGRHHTRPHYTRIWNFDALAGENEWLEGGDAIEAMMATRTGALPKKARKKAAVSKAEVGAVKTKKSELARQRVCVDLDGVLAKYDGWKGFDHIGQPLPGAREFANALAKIADIVIFTSRCSQDNNREGGTTISTGQLKIKVIAWLEKHEIPYVDVYTGQGKPLASAFIDDRGVSCSPQVDKNAFEKALSATRALLRRKKPDSPTVERVRATGKKSAAGKRSIKV